MNISEELLSEVLNIEREIKHIDFIEKWNTFICYVDGGAERTINIYELQHKCKEWAINNGYSIFTGLIHNKDDGTWCKCDVTFFTYEEEKYCTHFYNENSEPEAIFKACQWILDNKDKQ